MKSQLERRDITELLELETREDSPGPIIQGYSALFDVTADIYGMFTESIRKGAFTRAIAESDDCRCLFNHDTNYVLGRTKSGTLRLKETSKGLWIENMMPDTQIARDVMTSIRRGDVTGQSFAFTIEEQAWRFATKKGEMDHREILSVRLFDVGPVTNPMYAETSIGARSLAEESYSVARKEWEDQNRPEEPVVIRSVEPFLLRARVLRASVA